MSKELSPKLTPKPTPASLLDLDPLELDAPSKIEKELRFPFDVKNIRAKEVVTLSAFGKYPDPCYDVTCFSSVQFVSKQVCNEVQKLYPGYQFKIYAYRAKKKTAGTSITKLVFNLKPDHNKKFVHINLDLL